MEQRVSSKLQLNVSKLTAPGNSKSIKVQKNSNFQQLNETKLNNESSSQTFVLENDSFEEKTTKTDKKNTNEILKKISKVQQNLASLKIVVQNELNNLEKYYFL
jgi:hypothetical protein